MLADVGKKLPDLGNNARIVDIGAVHFSLVHRVNYEECTNRNWHNYAPFPTQKSISAYPATFSQ